MTDFKERALQTINGIRDEYLLAPALSDVVVRYSTLVEVRVSERVRARTCDLMFGQLTRWFEFHGRLGGQYGDGVFIGHLTR